MRQSPIVPRVGPGATVEQTPGVEFQTMCLAKARRPCRNFARKCPPSLAKPSNPNRCPWPYRSAIRKQSSGPVGSWKAFTAKTPKHLKRLWGAPRNQARRTPSRTLPRFTDVIRLARPPTYIPTSMRAFALIFSGGGSGDALPISPTMAAFSAGSTDLRDLIQVRARAPIKATISIRISDPARSSSAFPNTRPYCRCRARARRWPSS